MSKVYLVLHHEAIQLNNEYIIDDIVMFAASTESKALHFLKTAGVDEHSFWEIVEWEVDERIDEGRHIGWYGRRGGKLKEKPSQKAIDVLKRKNEKVFSDTVHEGHIRDLAFQLWLKADKPDGDGVEFWLEAEKQLRCLSVVLFRQNAA
jgi:hypothetical protein